MKILYIYAHPNPCSFNALLKQHALTVFKQHHIAVTLVDLYTMRFNAVASWDDFNGIDPTRTTQYFIAQKQALINNQLTQDIVKQLNYIKAADHLIIQFPLWWFSVPAILKGWFDRVLVKGFAYDSDKVFAQGLLQGKTASFTITTQSPAAAYQLSGAHQATVETFIHPITHMLRFVGIKNIHPFIVYGAFNLQTNEQQQVIEKYEDYLLQLKTHLLY